MADYDSERKSIDYEKLFDKVIDSFDAVFYINRKDNTITEIKKSGSFSVIYETDDAAKVIKEFRNTVYPEDLKEFEAFNLCSGKKFVREIRCKINDNRYTWYCCKYMPVNDHSYYAMFFDLSQYETKGMRLKSEYFEKKLEADINAQLYKQKFNALLNHADMVLFEYDMRSKELSVDSNLKDSTILIQDYHGSFDDFLKMKVIDENDAVSLTNAVHKLKYASCVTVNVHLRKNDEEYIRCEANLYGIYNSTGEVRVVVGSLKPNIDIPEISEDTEDMVCLRDEMTGLLNGKGFCMEMKRILNDNPNKNFAVVMVDIERFKSVNEIHGIPFGDTVIKYIAMNLEEVFNYQYCLTSRFMSDFFGIFTSYTDEADLRAIIERLNSRISYYKHISLKYAYGVYKITDRTIPVRLMCDYANMAKNSVKGNHINNIEFYTEGMKNRIIEELNIENDMEKALEEEQFAMYLQPKYNIGDGSVVGAEALARWIHPSKGFIKPFKFIPLFEKNGFIIHLDAYIWEQACKSIRKWIDFGMEPIPISVNVSRVNLKNPRLIDILDNLIDKYKIEKKYLELEITETVYYDDQQGLVNVLEKLKSSGYTLLMDDFGSGFSSLSMLKNTPFDVLKIDRNFLNETMITDRGKKIIQHTICLSNDIGMNIVAEGVETKEQADYLFECGCNVAQGYYYSKPVTISNFEEILGYVNHKV